MGARIKRPRITLSCTDVMPTIEKLEEVVASLGLQDHPLEDLDAAMKTISVSDAVATVETVETAEKVREMVDTIAENGTKEVAIDIEGVDLCRSGEVSIIQLSDGKTTWIVDVLKMGEDAFSEGGLRDLLQTPSVLKVGFDGRADADALFHLHSTKLVGFYDLQIASCKRQDKEQGRRDRFVHGLGKAMAAFLTNEPDRAARLEQVKKKGLSLFAPEKGGSYDVWKERPIQKDLVDYAAADVALLLEMKRRWVEYSPVFENVARSTVRINKAVLGERPAKGRHMALKDF